MSDNKLLFHLLFWKTDLVLIAHPHPSMSLPTSVVLIDYPNRTNQTDLDTLE